MDGVFTNIWTDSLLVQKEGKGLVTKLLLILSSLFLLLFLLLTIWGIGDTSTKMT